MSRTPPSRRVATVVCVAILLSACQQVDQALPLGLAAGELVSATVDQNGGIVSFPPSFSIRIPAGAVASATPIVVTPRNSTPYPADAGIPVPGTAFDVQPIGTTLTQVATVEVALPPEMLEAGEALRAVLAVEALDGSVRTFDGIYDLTSGVLRADVDVLGPMAVVVARDALPVEVGEPPALGGGTFPAPGPGPVDGPALSNHGGVEFTAMCAPEVRQCFSSGLLRVWADSVVTDRYGDQLFLIRTRVDATLDFIDFDINGVPTSLVGSVTIDGALRARLNRVVTSYDLDDAFRTGTGGAATTTSLEIVGSAMIVAETTTSDGTIQLDEEIEFGIDGVGTTEMLVIRLEADLDFENADGTTSVGRVVAHLRLRR